MPQAKYSQVYERSVKRERNLNIAQVMEILNCSRRQVYKLTEEGKIICFRNGDKRGMVWPESSIDSFIDKRKKEEAKQ